MKKIRINNKQKYFRLLKKHKQSKEERTVERDSFVDAAKNIVSLSKCILKDGYVLDKDFVFAWKFVCEKYPEASLNDVSAYICSCKKMDEVEMLKTCGGCYVPSIKTILIKDGQSELECKTDVDKCLNKYRLNCSFEDVFVHELFHAVSHSTDRRTREFASLEEEFVYKSTIEWFLDKGLSREDVVNKNFLPFAIQDVLSRQRLDVLTTVYPGEIKQEWLEDRKKVNKLIESCAEEFVEEAVERAKEVGRKMAGINRAVKEREDNRFALLDLD